MGEKVVSKIKKRFKHPFGFTAHLLEEFEQGRPLIEAIKNKNPNQTILLSFF